MRGPQTSGVPQSFPHPRPRPQAHFLHSFSPFGDKFLRSPGTLFGYPFFSPKQKFTAPDWISRLPSPRPRVEIKIEWQTEIELKLLWSSPPEHMSANYLHVKGIFDLWGSPGAWREGPWKIGVAAFTPSSFYLAIGETHTIRWQAFTRLASPITRGQEISPTEAVASCPETGG